jgi:tyrosine-protein kinase Etk/Wzc
VRGYKEFTAFAIPENELPEVAAEYLNLQAETQLRQSLYIATRQTLETTLLEQQGSLPKFQVLERAEVPEVKSGPSRTRSVIIGTVAVFFLAILLSFLIEYFERASLDPRESIKLLQIQKHLRLRKR